MGDTEQDGIHDNVTCEITKLNSAQTKTKTVVEYSSPNRRMTSLKIGLFVSVGLNVIFVVLFIVVFIMLSNVNTRLAGFDELLNKDKSRSAELSGSNNGQSVEAQITPTNNVYRRSTKAQELLVMFCCT